MKPFNTWGKKKASHAHEWLLTRAALVCLVVTALGFFAAIAKAQTPPPPPSRPILFVHGFCGASSEWKTLRNSLAGKLNSNLSDLYPSVTNYDVYYDGQAQSVVFVDDTGTHIDSSQILPSSRFFTIRFYDSVLASFDSTNVAGISILNKAYELSRVLKAIASVTHVKDAIVISHSMGGLVTRAYIENLASVDSCQDFFRNRPEYSNGLCAPGQNGAGFTDGVALLVTLDTPHAGTPLASLSTGLINACYASDSVNKSELNILGLGGSGLVEALNYASGSSIGGVLASKNGVPIQAVKSYFNDVTAPWDDVLGFLNGFSDDVVLITSQSVQANLPAADSTGELKDIKNDFSSSDPGIGSTSACWVTFPIRPLLHFLDCVGAQQQSVNSIYNSVLPYTNGSLASINVQVTLDNNTLGAPVSWVLAGPKSYTGTTSQSITDVPPGRYTLFVNSGPSITYEVKPSQTQEFGWDPITLTIRWDLTFALNFVSGAAGPPVVTTIGASAIQGDGVTLNATVNPNGSPATAWFEWGTSSSLQSFSSTTSQSVGSSSSGQAVSFSLGGLESSTTYYFRIAASNGATTVRGSILSFTTLGTLPKPTLQSPSNGATSVSNTPNFNWTVVPNSTSYRLIVATNPGVLPTDVTSAVCGTGCVLDVTPTSTTYSPPSGILESRTTYYWEVHARSPSQFGDWSAISSFTVGISATNDFSLQVTPNTQSVPPSGTVTYSLLTATTTGSPQSVSLGLGNLPTGVTGLFNPQTFTSGSGSALTLNIGSTVPAGVYTLTIIGFGVSTSHNASIGLSVVNPSAGNPQLTASPSSHTFSPQTVNTASAPFVISLVNSGSAPLMLTSIIAPTGFVPSFLNGLGLPITLQPSGFANMQVVFIPTTTGSQQGSIKIFNTTNASPFVITLAGTGLAAPVTTGNIQVNATFNGQPWSGTVGYTLTGPQSFNGSSAPNTFYNVTPGAYTLTHTVTGPGGATFVGITPSATQSVAAGNTITFTLNFTGPNSFGISDPQPASTVIGIGSSAQFQVPLCIISGSTQTVSIVAAGAPPSANVAFSGNPVIVNGCGVPETLTISTSSSTPPGIYSIVVTGTNQDGFSTSTPPITLTVDQPPRLPTRLVSLSSAGVQGNGISGALQVSSNFRINAVSASGRYVAFVSSADNLVANDTNGQPDIFVRDTQANTTIRVSVATDGTQADGESLDPSISADGRYVGFASFASNLYPGSVLGTPGIYVHDIQAGTTTRIDLAPSGVPANGKSSCCASLSSDGRFVAFWSNASNLLPSATNGGTFVFDTKAKTMFLASVASDGTPGNLQGPSTPQISADGRFVVFTSSSTNLVSGDTNGRPDVFVHDFQTQQTVRVNVANDGTQDDCGVITTTLSPVTISADGRYVEFLSCGHALVPGVTNPNSFFGVYVHDMSIGQISLLSITVAGNLFNAANIGTPSADGRFVVFDSFLEDRTTGLATLMGVAADGSNGNGTNGAASISADGSTIVISSNSTNLVPNDVNNFTDVFLMANPFLGSTPVNSLTLSSSPAPGGGTVTGTVALNGVAPAGGATVRISSNNGAAQVPAVLLIPPGATSGTFSVDTSIVPQETVLTVVTSYNGGASAAVLTLEPAAVLAISPSSWDFGNQPVGTKSAPNIFSITNPGTAPLKINSIGLSSGHVFSMSSNICTASLAAGSACSAAVVFNPTASGLVSDSLQISYGSPATVQSVFLLGSGATPSVSLVPGTADFGTRVISTSTSAIITLSNTGGAPLSSVAATVTGANASDFSISSDNCSGTTLQANSSCLITVAFSPKALGLRTANLSVTDNAVASPQSVSLTGNATDFSLGAAVGGSTSATITAGQTATYNLQISPSNGLTGQITLSCTGAPPLAFCSPSSSSITVNGTASAFTVIVTTTASSGVQLRTPRQSPPAFIDPHRILVCLALALGMYLLFAPSNRSKLKPALMTLFLFALLMTLTSCGGASPPVVGSPGTPTGTFTLTVSGVSGGATRNLSLTLTVK
jgi:pimeloyl-ACP methyl ester carboxylesterase